MKPTGATIDDEVDPVDRLLDTFRYSHDTDKIVAARLQLKGLINERELLREIAKDALRFREEVNGKCSHDEAMTKLCTQCEIRAALNDATPGTSAGGG